LGPADALVIPLCGRSPADRCPGESRSRFKLPGGASRL